MHRSEPALPEKALIAVHLRRGGVADRVSREKRSEIMRAVKSKNTTPEMIVRKLVFSLGYRYRLHRRDLPGRPDLVFPKYRIALFVHGCFWHRHPGCSKATMPKTNVAMWRSKFKRNVERDALNIADITNLGWRAEVIWECETKSPELLQLRIEEIFSCR